LCTERRVTHCKRPAGQAWTCAKRLQERLDLVHRGRAYPRTLSGGERQRAAIARALINRPPLILAAEPSGNLDSQKGQDVLMILHDIARDDGCSVVLVTHDPRVVEVADRILWLADGRMRDRKEEAPAWVRDPVCGMSVDALTATLMLDHHGQRVVFCSERCRQRFVAEPSRYLGSSPRLGGPGARGTD
jgi:putative ABC transport system ATP-binding protein